MMFDINKKNNSFSYIYQIDIVLNTKKNTDNGSEEKWQV